MSYNIGGVPIPNSFTKLLTLLIVDQVKILKCFMLIYPVDCIN